MKVIIKDFIFILAGTLILALGYSYFLVPNSIASGGASGVATILYSKFGISVPFTVLVINGVLFSVSWKTLPKSVFVKSFIGTVALTVFLGVFQDVSPFTNDVLLASAFGGSLIGVGVGIVIRHGASTGGSDFLAIVLYKLLKKRVSVANLIFVIDGLIIVTAGLLLNDYTLMLYTVISAFITSKITDGIVEGGNVAKSVYIISEKHEEISNKIIYSLNRGATGLYGKGLYTNKDTMLILCVVTRNEIPMLENIVKEIDSNAFIILSDVREVFGEGF